MKNSLLFTPAKDLEEAAAWNSVAAEQGDADAMLLLGLIHGDRESGELYDPAKADEWLRKAAERGNARAADMLKSDD